MSDAGRLGALRGSAEWTSFVAWKPRLDLFGALRSVLRENASSRMVAWLLDSRAEHGLGRHPVDALVEAAGGLSACWPGLEGCATRTECEWATSARRRLDVLVRFERADGRIAGVLGIENKPWSDELDDQVGHYQEALARSFPEAERLLVFLTPAGRASETARGNATPCRPLGHADLIRAWRPLAAKASPAVSVLFTGFLDHLERTFVGGAMSEARTILVDMFKSPEQRTAARLLRREWPRWHQCLPRVLEGLRDRVGAEPELTRLLGTWACTVEGERRWDINAFRIQPHAWGAASHGLGGFHVLYYFHSPDPETALSQVHLAAWCASPEARRAVLGSSLSQELRALGDPRPDEDGWGDDRWALLWRGREMSHQDLDVADVSQAVDIVYHAIATTAPLVHAHVAGGAWRAMPCPDAGA